MKLLYIVAITALIFGSVAKADIITPLPMDLTFDYRNVHTESEKQNALKTLNQMSSAEGVKKSKALESRVDNILVAFGEGRLSLPNAINNLLDPENLKDTGYLLVKEPPRFSVVGTPTVGNFQKWKSSITGAMIHPQFRHPDGAFIEPGYVLVTAPIQHDVFDNHLLALRYLGMLSEELYHVAQKLRGANRYWNSKMFISSYFGNRKFSPTNVFYEGDVYAKLLEILGLNYPFEWLESSYGERKLVDRRRILRKSKNLSCIKMLSS